ncbi:MAG: thioredoxin fold domain-containing protein [Sulfurospirillum sp.]|nr:thioredoxin fold domain-containing protein [Sulfurospirillum sp.]
MHNALSIKQPFEKGLLRFLLICIALCHFAFAKDLDIAQFLQEAQKQDKHLLFFHHIPRCPYCKTMLDENFQDTAMKREIEKNFILVDIYTATQGNVKYKDFRGSYKEFSLHVGAFAYPATIFMNSKGEIIHEAIGYRNREEYTHELLYVSSKSYQKMDLQEFIVQKEMQ